MLFCVRSLSANTARLSLRHSEKRTAAAALFFYVYMVDYFAFSIKSAQRGTSSPALSSMHWWPPPLMENRAVATDFCKNCVNSKIRYGFFITLHLQIKRCSKYYKKRFLSLLTKTMEINEKRIFYY